MRVEDEMRDRLNSAFSPSRLEIEDESERHRGHAGWREGGQSHFRIEIASPAFDGMSRIDRHRAVHDALGADLVGRIHALSMKIES